MTKGGNSIIRLNLLLWQVLMHLFSIPASEGPPISQDTSSEAMRLFLKLANKLQLNDPCFGETLGIASRVLS